MVFRLWSYLAASTPMPRSILPKHCSSIWLITNHGQFDDKTILHSRPGIWMPFCQEQLVFQSSSPISSSISEERERCERFRELQGTDSTALKPALLCVFKRLERDLTLWRHVNNRVPDEGWVELNWLFNVTINDISVIYVTALRCAGGLKKKLDLRSGSQRHRHFVGFFNVPVLAPTRDQPFYTVIPTHRPI